MNLYDQQSANRRRTWLIVFGFIGFLLLLGIGFDTFFIGATGSYVPVFLIAASAYLVALALVHALVPRLEPAELEARG